MGDAMPGTQGDISSCVKMGSHTPSLSRAEDQGIWSLGAGPIRLIPHCVF